MVSKNIDSLYLDLKKGSIASLAAAITLVESESLNDQVYAEELLQKIFSDIKNNTFRIGISGAPGVGKSTFINRLGLSLIVQGYKVAVLAIDPSSEISYGSILGDKTRMEELSRSAGAYIRPSSSRGFLGGVHPATRDTIRICETAGYDVILVETVGVGQSETAVSDLVDYFLLISSPGGGDELQGIKKGLLEKIDGVVINKADVSQKIAAEITEKQIQSALSILRNVKIPTQRVSSIENTGIKEVLEMLIQYWEKTRSDFQEKRRLQDSVWLEKQIHVIAMMNLKDKLYKSEMFKSLRSQVIEGKADVRSAALSIVKSLT